MESPNVRAIMVDADKLEAVLGVVVNRFQAGALVAELTIAQTPQRTEAEGAVVLAAQEYADAIFALWKDNSEEAQRRSKVAFSDLTKAAIDLIDKDVWAKARAEAYPEERYNGRD